MDKFKLVLYTEVRKLKETLLIELIENLFVDNVTTRNYQLASIYCSNKFSRLLKELIETKVEEAVRVKLDSLELEFKEKFEREIYLNLNETIDRIRQKLYQDFKGKDLIVRLELISNAIYNVLLSLEEVIQDRKSKIRYLFQYLDSVVYLGYRLLLSEIFRMERETTIIFCMDNNINSVIWKTAYHSKTDVCNQYNGKEYLLTELPAYPHPFCRCQYILTNKKQED